VAEKLRIDKYLWAIRIFKTRSLASEAIDSGKVRTLDGQSVKASRAVGIGDQYEIRTPARKWIIKVSGLLMSRASFEIAQQYYVDLTPEEEKLSEKPLPSSFFTGKRLSKTGRPTKKQRRDLNDLLSNDSEDG
jgi:ribosome-associated heat shock protein Hsp15